MLIIAKIFDIYHHYRYLLILNFMTFNNLDMSLHSWNSTIEEAVFTFETMHICRIFSDLTINIVLLGFGKYNRTSGQHQKDLHKLHNFDNLPALVKSSAKATIFGSLSG